MNWFRKVFLLFVNYKTKIDFLTIKFLLPLYIIDRVLRNHNKNQLRRKQIKDYNNVNQAEPQIKKKETKSKKF